MCTQPYITVLTYQCKVAFAVGRTQLHNQPHDTDSSLKVTEIFQQKIPAFMQPLRVHTATGSYSV
jgi:hypothetical protein